MSRSDQKDYKVGLEELFYSKPLFMSYSALNLLLHSPKVYYKRYVLLDKDDHMSDGMLEGKVIHALMDEINFDKNFVVSPIKLPNEDTKKLIDRLFYEYREKEYPDWVFSDHSPRILELLKEIDLHQTLKTDQQRLDKIITNSNISYYKFLKTKEGKDVIDQDMLNRCKESANILKNDKKIADLLKLNNTNTNIKVHNEYPFQIDLAQFPFGLKGIIDNMVINEETKTIDINDLKTTSKTIAEFHESIAYFNYNLQAAIYYHFAKHFNPKYTIKFTFIVIDKYQQVYPFEVSKKTMNEWYLKFEETLDIALFHYEHKKWSLPYLFEKETVIL